MEFFGFGSSIFRDGKLKPGVYKIRNIVSKTYVDTKDDARELCGRPSTVLEDGSGQWEIQPFGPGYIIRKAEPSTSARPGQFCTMLNGIGKGYAISVSEFPGVWKIEVVNDTKYRGLEYVRIFWGSTNMVWDLAQWGCEYDWTKVQIVNNNKPEPWRMWELIPVETGNIRGRLCTCSHPGLESGDSGFETTVVEVTTVTTRKKHQSPKHCQRLILLTFSLILAVLLILLLF